MTSASVSGYSMPPLTLSEVCQCAAFEVAAANSVCQAVATALSLYPQRASFKPLLRSVFRLMVLCRMSSLAQISTAERARVTPV